MQGVRNWVHELDQRNKSALLNVQDELLKENSKEFEILAQKGYEIAGGYHQKAFWDVNYSFQYEKMKSAQDMIENITGKPMRVFGSRYFAYDENTLKAAEELGVEFILARGTDDVEAVIYKPKEYNVRIISVSNVEFEKMGRGSLCDYSLWARGATAEDLQEKLDYALNKSPQRLMVVSHAYLGGVKQSWWETYEEFLDSDEVHWIADFDEWVSEDNGINRELPLDQIPVNREVQYVEPQPAEPLEGLKNVSQMHNPCAVQLNKTQNSKALEEDVMHVFHNNQGPMCKDLLGWLEDFQQNNPALRVKQHLTTNQTQQQKLSNLIAEYEQSKGASESFGYLPIIFFKGNAYSGFNEEVGMELAELANENR